MGSTVDHRAAVVAADNYREHIGSCGPRNFHDLDSLHGLGVVVPRRPCHLAVVDVVAGVRCEER